MLQKLKSPFPSCACRSAMTLMKAMLNKQAGSRGAESAECAAEASIPSAGHDLHRQILDLQSQARNLSLTLPTSAAS